MRTDFNGLSLSTFLAAVKKQMVSNNNGFYKALNDVNYGDYLEITNSAGNEDGGAVGYPVDELCELLADYYAQPTNKQIGYMADGSAQRRYLDILSSFSALSDLDTSATELDNKTISIKNYDYNVKCWMREKKPEKIAEAEITIQQEYENHASLVRSTAANINMADLDYNPVARMISKDIRTIEEIKTDAAKNELRNDIYNYTPGEGETPLVIEQRINSNIVNSKNKPRGNIKVFDISFLSKKLADRYVGNYQPDDYGDILKVMDDSDEYAHLLKISDSSSVSSSELHTLTITKYNIADFLAFQNGDISEFQGLHKPIDLKSYTVLFK